MKRIFSTLGAAALVIFVVAACNNGGAQSPHGSRCLLETDCMSGQVCSKGSDLLGNCVPQGTQPGTQTATKPSDGKQDDGTKPKPASTTKSADPLPPPKPPKTAPGTKDDSTFAP